MVRDFHMPLGFALDELRLDQAFALLAWNTEANPWGAVSRTTAGYIKQEMERTG